MHEMHPQLKVMHNSSLLSDLLDRPAALASFEPPIEP